MPKQKRTTLRVNGRLNKRNGGKREVFRSRQAPAAKYEVASLPAQSTGGKDNLKLYLREIGQVKLLTPQQEIDLAAKIKKGDKKAREQMIKANLRLVVKIAHDYEGYGLPLLDLISEGNIGLMKAVERFDPAKGGKLSTYGSWWIKQSIKRALANQSKTIRLPVHMVDKIAQMRRVERRLHEEFGREPTEEELAAELDISTKRLNDMRSAAVRPASLDAPIGDDEQNLFADVVADDNAENASDILEDANTSEILRQLVETLDPREAVILKYRFGLNGHDPLTLEEVGEKFGVTRERVRQIQNIALRKLRNRLGRVERGSPALKIPLDDASEQQQYTFDIADEDRTRFRASPAFVNWKPTGELRRNFAAAVRKFVGFAYEISADFRTAKQGVAAWARCVCIYIMKNDVGMKREAICTDLNCAGHSVVADAHTRIELAAREDKFVGRDIKALREHFRKVMGLETQVAQGATG